MRFHMTCGDIVSPMNVVGRFNSRLTNDLLSPRLAWTLEAAHFQGKEMSSKPKPMAGSRLVGGCWLGMVYHENHDLSGNSSREPPACRLE